MNEECNPPGSESPDANRRALVSYALACVGLLAILLWSSFAPSPGGWLSSKRTFQLDGNTYRTSEREWKTANERARINLSEDERSRLTKLEKQIDERVRQAYLLPRSLVDETSDWYYSLTGQGVRILMGAKSLWPGASGNDLHLTERLTSHLFPEEQWTAIEQGLRSEFVVAMGDASQQSLGFLKKVLHHELALYRVDKGSNKIEARIDINWDAGSMLLEMNARDLLFEQSTMGLSTAALATLASRRGAQMATTRMAGRGVAAKGAAACIGTGPLAKICAAGFFTGTFLATELAILQLDEILNREAFEAALLEDIDRMEKKSRERLKAELLGGLQVEFAARRSLISEKVRPIDLLFQKSL